VNFSECYNLERLARKCVFVIAVVSFVAVTTGLTQQLHILSHEHPHEHDVDNCLVCQQLIALGKFYSETHPVLDNIILFEYILDYYTDTLLIFSQPKPFDCRPPPLAPELLS
jgi:hypothetical protein